MKVLTHKSDAIDFANVVVALDGCEEGVAWLQQFTGRTLGELAAAFGSDPVVKSAWGHWVMDQMGDQLEPSLHRYFLEPVKNPMSAFQLYIRGRNLTEEDSVRLEARFKGKLPTAEEELASGKVVRRGNNGV